MADPKRLRTLLLLVVAIGLILAGVFSLVQPEEEITQGPTIPVVPVLPSEPNDDDDPLLPLPVVSIVKGLNNEEIGTPYRLALWRNEVYIVDALAVDGIIKVFDSRGNYLRSFGSLGVGGLSFVVDMDVDSRGNVVVLDTTPAIHVFSPQGEQLKRIEIDVGFLWSKAVQATANKFYVVALSNLLRMSDTGQVTAVWPTEEHNYSLGTAASEYYLGPSGLAATSRGLWVTDSVNSRLLLLSYEGELMQEVVLPPAEDGRSPYPTSIATDILGNLYVVDATGMRIMLISASGEVQWEENLEARTDSSHPEEIHDIVILGPGRLLVSDAWSRTVEIWEFTADGVTSKAVFHEPNPAFMFPKDVVSIGEELFMLCAETGLGGESEYTIYRQSTRDAAVETFSSSFSGESLNNPVRLAADSERIYVLELNRVLVYGLDGTELSVLGDDPTDWGGFAVSTVMGEAMGPQGLAVSNFGEVYVADTFANRLVVFHVRGEFIRQLPLQDNVFPVSLAFAKDGTHLFILNSYEGQVIKTDVAGNMVLSFASAGQEEGQLGVVSDLGVFDGPRDIGVDSAGDVYVLDTYNARLVRFSSSGASLGVRGYFGGNPGEFYLPSGMFINFERGLMYVADTYNHRIQVVVVPW